MRYLVAICFAMCVFTCKTNTRTEDAKESFLLSTFRFTTNNAPQISVHRGGKGIKGYPENCLETLKLVNDSISGIFEIDIAKTKDGKLVLMHDNTIDRTTTGSGLIKNRTYNELLGFDLVDDFGDATRFKVPLFSEVLKWSKANNVVLSVDIKRSVPQEDVLKLIQQMDVQNQVIVITYSIEQAQDAYRLAPEMMLSVSARNDTEFDRLLNSGIPTKNMIAFTGTRLSNPSLYKRLHDNDILTILGTLGNLDKRAKARGDNLYNEWLQLGADILATDRPFAVAKALKQ